MEYSEKKPSILHKDYQDTVTCKKARIEMGSLLIASLINFKRINCAKPRID